MIWLKKLGTYNETKSRLSSFYDTSTSELENTAHIKHIPNRNFNSDMEHLSSVTSKQRKIVTKNIKNKNETIQSDSSVESVSMFSNLLVNAPKLSVSNDIFDLYNVNEHDDNENTQVPDNYSLQIVTQEALKISALILSINKS